MRAVIVPVMGMPKVVEIENDYRALQKCVGGTIDAVGWIFDDKPTVYVNDDGKCTYLPNRVIYATEEHEAAGLVGRDGKPIKAGDVLDVIYGDFVCCGFDPETGKDRDISDEEIKRVFERFGAKESIGSGETQMHVKIETTGKLNSAVSQFLKDRAMGTRAEVHGMYVLLFGKPYSADEINHHGRLYVVRSNKKYGFIANSIGDVWDMAEQENKSYTREFYIGRADASENTAKAAISKFKTEHFEVPWWLSPEFPDADGYFLCR